MTSADGRDGFTLMETLIAFLILSGALAISAQTTAIVAKSLSTSKERAEVLQLANSLRAVTLPIVFRNKRNAEGADRTFRWKIVLTPIRAAKAAEAGAGFAVLTILSPSGRQHKFMYFGSDDQDAK